MALNYDDLMATSVVDLPYSYSDTETMLYALSVGMGRDPLNADELPYVHEQGAPLRAVPTIATVLVPDMFPPDLGWDFSQVLHVEQRMKLFRPPPVAADLLINKRIVAAYDRGPNHGALVLFEAEARLASDDTALFIMGNRTAHRPPRRAPDLTCDLDTRRDQALLYRLNGDRNPLHADPGLAGRVGFERPILHGLCTYGVACHAILKTICDYDYTLITSFDARFSAPVLPGDTITTDMWQDGNIVSFQCSVGERDVVVLKSGKCTLAA
jgi:acyl dehydratase